MLQVFFNIILPPINEVNEVDLKEMQALHKKEIDLMNDINEIATACVRGDGDI